MSTETRTREEVFDKVFVLSEEVQEQKAAVNAAAAEQLTQIAQTASLTRLDSGVVQTLWDLLPQIRLQVDAKVNGSERPLGVLARADHSSHAFLDAMLVAAQAMDTPLTGHHGQITITAHPESTQESLRTEYAQGWQSAPAADPFTA